MEFYRLLGLDIGHRRIGVAISDPMGISARPLTTVERAPDGADQDRLAQIALDHGVSGLVAGLPKHLDGREAESAEAIRQYGERLAERCGLPLVWAEERLSSKEAERVMAELRIPIHQRRKRRDEIAAALILTWYLESR